MKIKVTFKTTPSWMVAWVLYNLVEPYEVDAGSWFPPTETVKSLVKQVHLDIAKQAWGSVIFEPHPVAWAREVGYQLERKMGRILTSSDYWGFEIEVLNETRD